MKKLLNICLLVVLIFMSTSCSQKEKSSERELNIPVLADAAWLKADGAFYNGVQLAVEEANTEYSGKGFKIITSVIDDKDLYETGVEMATKAAEDETVTAVFNLQNFDVSKTTADILAGNGKLVLFPYGAYDSLFTKDNPYVLNGIPAFSDLGKAMAEYAVKKGYKRIAIYHNGNQSQEELVTAFELDLLNTGTKVVDYVPSIASKNEFDNIYSRWQALNVDCVVISQYGLDRAFEVLKMLRSRDAKIAVIGEPIFDSANALAENKAIAEGMAVPSTLVIEDSQKLKEFKERYRKKYGKEADIWAVQGYDMLRLVVDTAVKLDTNDPAKIAAALHNQKGYQGIGRNIAFTKGGAMITDVKKLPILICRDGRFQ
ncbi:ABC-type branched-chain amino acid transport system, periplasmic component [Desulfosporosinus orientis DSM 765]|uniref:ABC-type branched-chain amino acid transport system, periplasmic component n=1 Tax=Desulfosporosinus orientis (strain ATCC 19365 / DSM 765 / NCIMB 8382 / VKM B-1628 / Singapore I) TaxID=768706 RepID=G7W6V6_DESOD|nr:ABC transporter substrate-binding protein [Desulfosporosinus orientis]AET69238.1 ABC-type branched-chain amino acid transport system, periplasmic component [Desulfosporosinus orientis DSM 765]